MTGREYLFVLAFLAVWFVLNRWVLPLFGVPTCMSGSCGVDRRPTADGRAAASSDALPEKPSARPSTPGGDLHRQGEPVR
jgi:hypothetical protein